MPKKNPLNSGNPKMLDFGIYITAILSESGGDIRSVQRLTAQADRRRLGTRKCKYGGANFMKTDVIGIETVCRDCGKSFDLKKTRQILCTECAAERVKKARKKYREKTGGIKEKVCCNCEVTYIPTGRCQKHCASCTEVGKKTYMKDYHLRNYVRSGYNQRGENNNNWTGGIGIYRRLVKYDVCTICDSDKFIVAHHKDLNRYNNDPSNLECVCRSCHTLLHIELRTQSKGKDGKFEKVCKV